ncbi:MAG: cohesin domain-containing protein [Clostridia bacterium]
MKKIGKEILTLLLAITMLLSTMNVTVFSESANLDPTDTEMTVKGSTSKVQDDNQYIGQRAVCNYDTYVLHDGNLYVSKADGQDILVENGEISWVIAKGNTLYWAKIEGYNTAVYKSDAHSENKEVFARIFVPIEAFDILEDNIYYLYNGVIIKQSITTGEEETVFVDKTLEGFYLDDNGDIKEVKKFDTVKSYEYNEEPIPEEISVKLMEASDEEWLWPVYGHYSISSFYGYRKFWNSDMGAWQEGHHKGIDINDGNIYGATVYASKSGYVTTAIDNNKYNDGCGNHVIIDHGQYKTRYLHLSKVLTENKVWVEQGTPIGLVGNTGNSTGPHLHFDMNNALNPMPFDSSWHTYSTKASGKKSYSINYVYDESLYLDLSDSPTEVNDKNVYVEIIKCPGDSFVPKSFSIEGYARSESPIKNIKASLTNTDTGEVIASFNSNVGTIYYAFKGSALDKAIKFNYIKKSGTYCLKIEATNGVGNTQCHEKVFTAVVGGELVATKPSITSSITGTGQRAVISCSDSSVLIHYTVNGGSEKTGYGSVTENFTSEGTYNITAWTTKNGYTKSVDVYKAVSVKKVNAPYIGDVIYGEDGARVVISGDGTIYYTDDGSVPTKDSSVYAGPIYVNNSKTIRAIGASYGCVNSDVSEKYVNITVPDAPVIKLDTGDKIAQGGMVSVSWNKTDRATGYTAYLIKDGKEVKSVTTAGSSASFALDEKNDAENLEYTIKVVANNFKGKSNDSNSVKVTAMHPVTVTTVDKIVRENGVTDEVVNKIQQNVNNHDGDDAQLIEGNMISVQKIDYGTKPSKPSTPSKKGFTFAGYSEGLYYPATEDVTVYALYEINYYTVEFWHSYGEDKSSKYQLGNTQDVMYTESAVPPTDFEYPTGYTLAGWNVDSAVSTGYDYTYVEGNMKLYTSYTWGNENLPTVVKITGVSRDEKCTSYTVNLQYTNNNLSGTQARLIVSLYTADGRMIYTQTKDVDMDAFEIGESITDSVQLNYVNKISKVSAVMVQVKNDLTGGAVSEMACCEDIEFPDTSGYWAAWSEWDTTSVVESDRTQVETKTQYRYVDKQYTTSNTSTLGGWNHYNTTASVGNWSNWSQTYVSAFKNDAQWREVESYWEPATYKTQYHYFTYYKGSSAPWTHYSSSHPYFAEIWVDSHLPWNRYSGGIDQYGGSGYDFGYPFNRWLICDGTTYGGPGPWTREVQTGGGYNMYRYRDTYYTYYFWKWGDWSDWSDTIYTASGDRQVESRIVYRYRNYYDNYPGYDPSNDSTLEEQTLAKYEFNGILTGFDSDLSNRVATIMVYKKTNTDPTQEQLQYVDQITIGENNSYTFTVNPKEEIDYVNTGDYIVTLSVEGCERLVNVDVIKAPAPTYEVVFYSEDGVQFGDTQYVEYGGGVDVNEVGIPEKDGYRFVKWNKSVVDIKKNTSVTAVFEKEVYSVVFVDHENETVEIQEVAYGEPIIAPVVENVDGKEFMGWDLLSEDEETFATNSMVITAMWNTVTYTVTFCDFDGNVISEQVVDYGDSAELPEFVEVDGILCSWDLTHNKWWNVTSDMTVYPYMPQTVYVNAPTISIPTIDAYGTFMAELETADTDNRIYYIIDEAITDQDARSFVQMLTVDEGEEVSLMSEEISENSNSDSEYVEYIENEPITVEKIALYTEPIEIYAGATVYTFAVDDDDNISQISVFEYEYNWDEEDIGLIPEDERANLTVGNITAKAGETVTVPISIANNPGIAGFKFRLTYDKSVLTPVSVVKGSVLTTGTLTSNVQQGGDLSTLNYVSAFWSNPANVTDNGEILNVTFTVNNNAEDGTYPISITYEEGDITNQDYDDVALAVVNGSLDVINYMIGDVYADGKVNTKDSVRLGQYLADWDIELSAYERKSADIYVDNKINTKDGVKLSQYLADWDVELMNLLSVEAGKITFEAGEASAVDGYVDIPVTITENDGVAGFKLKLNYDKTLLTPVSVTKGSVLATGTMTSNLDQGGDLSKLKAVSVFWSNPSDVTGTGTAFTVRFKVSDSATENIPVNLSYDEGDICDQSYNDLQVTLVDGKVILAKSVTVTVDGEKVQTNGTITLGSDNGDGTCSLPDDVLGYYLRDGEGNETFVNAGKYNVTGGEIITSALMNVTMVDGAQVRYSGGIDAEGKISTGNGLRFLASVDRSSIGDGEAVAYGMKITAEGSDKSSIVLANSWQSDEVFTVAITNLGKNNYNRNYTATPFVKVKYADGTEKIVYSTQSITRSVYYVASGLLKNGKNGLDDYVVGESYGLYDVLNAYVNMVGVRLTLDSQGSVTARTEGNGAYTGEVFFDVTSIDNGDESYTITVTPVTDNFEYPVKIMSYWDEFVRINNNNSKVRANISDVHYNENGGVTFKFSMPQ